MAPESRDEVRQRIDSLYDQAENATGNFNATRAMAARTRSRGVPLAKRRSGQPDPALDEVARQWFDAARARLGPTVPAALPADRLPDRPSAPAASRDRSGGGLPGGETGAFALPGGERGSTGLPASDERAALGTGPSGRRPELERGADRAVAELTAGSTPDPTARPLAALENGRPALPGAWGTELPGAAARLPGRGVAEPGDRSRPEPAMPGPAALPEGGAQGPLGLAAPGSAPGLAALGTFGSAPELTGPGGLRSAPEAPGPGTADPTAGGFGETAVLPVAALPAAQAASVQVPGTLSGSGASGRPAPAVSKAGNRRKLATARELLARSAARPAVSGTAVQPDPARTAWDTGAQQVVAQPAVTRTGRTAQARQAGQATGQWQPQPWATPGGAAMAPAAPTTPAPLMGNTGTAIPVPVTDTGSLAYPVGPAPVTDTGSLPYLGAAAVTGTGTLPPSTAADVTDTGSLAYPDGTAVDVTGTGFPSDPTGTGPFAASASGSSAIATGSGSLPLPPPAPESPRALRAAKAIAFARAQLGKPCVWGATGPDSYDCSSLTQAAWKAAGVTLPRAAHEQALAGAPVTLTGLEPGDLVLFFDDDRHVGLHVGDGMMVHAPGPGSSIREESIYGAGEAAIHRIVRPA
ncbi:NlpC/P60 family protein [Streptomyces sp. NPDC048521]|uniref:C40 family peptidase n=1 Tax=Streptomyces sp. NPDC048521 TaxID=3365566 RepID=UPI00371385B6